MEHSNEHVQAREVDHYSDGALVSVIIPCYNQAHFLSEAIGSVLAQTYRYFEIVVVDDGSTDNTADVSSQAGIRYLRQENQGLSAARNTGIRYSQGRYLVFLDADDRLLPDALEIGLHCLKAHPECAFVYGGYRLIAADGSFLREGQQECVDGDHYLALLQRNYIAMHATVMYRRAVFDYVIGFDTSLNACEDYDLYLRIARTFPICCHNKVVAEYRRHGANMSRQPERMLKSVLVVLRSQWRYAKGNQRYKQAYKTGMRESRKRYSRRLVDEVVAHKRAGEWKEVTRGMLALLRYSPLRFAALIAQRVVPVYVSRRFWPRRQPESSPRVGRVRFGRLRRVTPISRDFGFRRGQPIDRFYIEGFLGRHAGDIQGHVLEIGEPLYTRRFGGSRVGRSDVLHVAEGDPEATIVADLTDADHIPSDTFDCIIFTQTLQFIYDCRSTVRTLHRILKPGGVLLATVPGISQLSDDAWRESWYWSFTTRSATRLLEEAFPAANIRVDPHGNVLAATAFLYGLAREDLRREELDYSDSDYQLLITIRAVKPA